MGKDYDDEVKSTLSGIKNINKDQKEKEKKDILKQEKNLISKKHSLDKLKNIFKKERVKYSMKKINLMDENRY
jgi:hypothetical protein